MALRALASKLRLPAALRRSPASRTTAPQDMVGSTAPPKPAEGGMQSLEQVLMEQQILAFERTLRRKMMWSSIAGNVIGLSAAYYTASHIFK
uniref:Uncharacterized protein n=1 Tax=Leersia perrieri TaxID=77586 RepID=A0A0D9WVF0_9ORYZ